MGDTSAPMYLPLLLFKQNKISAYESPALPAVVLNARFRPSSRLDSIFIVHRCVGASK